MKITPAQATEVVRLYHGHGVTLKDLEDFSADMILALEAVFGPVPESTVTMVHCDEQERRAFERYVTDTKQQIKNLEKRAAREEQKRHVAEAERDTLREDNETLQKHLEQVQQSRDQYRRALGALVNKDDDEQIRQGTT
jgi:septal ring factor EnvC (AmiA/AmiB activator)